METHRRNSCIAMLVLSIFITNTISAQVSLIEKEVSFQNDNITLSGTLLTPKGEGRFPTIVYLHGSGPMTREGFRQYAEEFAKMGFASLFYDKRGAGSSEGSWLTSSLNDLAGDALAAIQFLKNEEKIDSERIGFWGVSQAGWIAPIAVSHSKDVAFMILISGGGASPRESELYSYHQNFKKQNFSESEMNEASKILDLYFNYLGTGQERSELLDKLESIQGNRLNSFAQQLGRIIPSESNRVNWSWVSTYTPLSDIKNVGCPILLLFGDQDTNHPTKLAVERWREGLNIGGNSNATVVVFPSAGHGIRMREGYTGQGRPPFADGYLELQLGWLLKHVLNKAD